jgi:ribonuclease-3
MNSTEFLQEKLGYAFANVELLTQALTHSSYANEHNVAHYERLEFLGDAVIELAVSSYIYNNFNLSSGDLSKLRASLVSTDNLNSISINLNLEEYVLKSNSLPKISKKTSADLFESIVGAVFLDGGINKASEIVNNFVIIDFHNVESHLNNLSDAKSTLQELLQKENHAWEYKTINSYGLDHEKTFVVALYIDNNLASQAEGKSLHLAQNECARKYLQDINMY